MKTYNGITLKFRNEKRKNYMSMTHLVNDLTSESLIEVLSACTLFRNQMTIMKEVDKRGEVGTSEYWRLLETCNGIQ